jgi:hypothetical protein
MLGTSGEREISDVPWRNRRRDNMGGGLLLTELSLGAGEQCVEGGGELAVAPLVLGGF